MKSSFDPVFNPTKPKPYYKSICFIFTLAVFVTSGTGVIVLWGTDAWNIMLLKIITFEDDGYIYNFWKKPEFITTINVYPFNYTNIDRIGTEKPHVVEVGPYVFRERMEKVDVVFNNDGTLTYSENHTHEFDERASSGFLEDVIYTPNVPLMSAALSGAQRSVFAQIPLAALLKGLDTRLFLPIDIEGFLMGFDDSFSIIARQLSQILNGDKPPKFGLLASRVGVSPDRVTIGTGIPDLTRVGIISQYDGISSLNYWKTDECNSIEGSDGNVFPGMLVQTVSRLYVYVKTFCRRIPIDFLGERILSVQNFPGKRYELPHNIFDLPKENPENSCFCSEDQCSPKGTFKTSVCTFGAATSISFPHFLHGDPDLRENVTGLFPDAERHRFYLDLHETLGIPIGGHYRFQLNVVVKHCPYITQLNSITDNTILPIAWVDIAPGELQGDLEDIIYHATYTVAYLNIALSWTSLLLLLASSGRLICFFYYSR